MNDDITQTAPPNGRTGTPTGARIVFLASLPPILSAISFSGTGDGARVKLDIPGTDADAMVLLSQLGANKLLKVTIEVIE